MAWHAASSSIATTDHRGKQHWKLCLHEPCHRRGSPQYCQLKHQATRIPPVCSEKCKLRWHGNVTRSTGIVKDSLQGTVRGKRKRDRQRKNCTENIKKWTGCNVTTQVAATDRQRWSEIIRSSEDMPYRPPTFMGCVKKVKNLRLHVI